MQLFMLWFGMVWYGTYLMNMVSYILERSHNRRYIHITLLSYLIYADMHHTILHKIPNKASDIYDMYVLPIHGLYLMAAHGHKYLNLPLRFWLAAKAFFSSGQTVAGSALPKVACVSSLPGDLPIHEVLCGLHRQPGYR